MRAEDVEIGKSYVVSRKLLDILTTHIIPPVVTILEKTTFLDTFYYGVNTSISVKWLVCEASSLILELL